MTGEQDAIKQEREREAADADSEWKSAIPGLEAGAADPDQGGADEQTRIFPGVL